MKFLQLTAGFDAQLVEQHLPRPAELGQRLRLPPRLEQRQHELPAQPLPQRIPVHLSGQLTQQLPGPARLQLQIDRVLDRQRPALVQHRRGLTHRGGIDLGAGRATPQIESLPVRPARGLRVRRRPGGLHQPEEDVHVQVLRADGDPVAGPIGADHIVRQYPAQPRHARLQLTACGGRRLRVPDRGGQLAEPDDPAGVQQQHREANPVAPGGHRHRLTVDGHLQRPEQTETPFTHRSASRSAIAKRCSARIVPSTTGCSSITTESVPRIR
jgi:hypothetical protein